jgi:hypothetical protein
MLCCLTVRSRTPRRVDLHLLDLSMGNRKINGSAPDLLIRSSIKAGDFVICELLQWSVRFLDDERNQATWQKPSDEDHHHNLCEPSHFIPMSRPTRLNAPCQTISFTYFRMVFVHSNFVKAFGHAFSASLLVWHTNSFKVRCFASSIPLSSTSQIRRCT